MRVPLMFMIGAVLSMLLAAVSVKGMPESSVVRPVPLKQWTEGTKVWAARSVIGEAGWGSPQRPHEIANEWVSIVQVYAVRYQEVRQEGMNWPLVKIIRKYSAAVKQRSTHVRPWILSIGLDCVKPKHWPKELKWKSVHKPICERAFLVLDRWANGDIKTLTPQANHYGGAMDAYVAEQVRKWKRVPAPEYYGNKFYDSRRLTGKPFILEKFGNTGVPMFGNLELVRPKI